MSSEPATRAAERLAVIVDAAERAALSVIDDAEQEAKRYLEDAQSRADRIVAERLREVADLLESSGLDVAAPRLRAMADEAVEHEEPADDGEALKSEKAVTVEEAEEDEDDDPEEPSSPEERPAPVLAAEPPQPKGEGGSAAARLLATQMAVSGSSREEIEERLRSGFEIDDASAIIDAILGPEA